MQFYVVEEMKAIVPSSHYPLPPSQPSPTGEGEAKHFPLRGK